MAGVSQGEHQEVLDKMVADGATLYEIDICAFAGKAMGAVVRLEEEGMWSKGLFEDIQAIE